MVARPRRDGRTGRVSRAKPPPRAVIDADIIYSRVLHDLMGRVADDLGLLDLVWSRQLLAEAEQALIKRKGLAEEVAQRWVGYLSESFPGGETSIEEAQAGLAVTAARCQARLRAALSPARVLPSPRSSRPAGGRA